MLRMIKIRWLKFWILWESVELESLERTAEFRRFNKRNLEARLRMAYFGELYT